MIPYEELAAALAGQRPAARPVPQNTVIDTKSGGRPIPQNTVPQHTIMDQPPVLPPPMDDETLNGQDIATGEVDIGDVLTDEDV
jgi:hypothetical protein